MLTTIVRLRNKAEATRLLNYLEAKGISRQSIRETIHQDQRMARELLGTALVEMRKSERRNGGGLL